MDSIALNLESSNLESEITSGQLRIHRTDQGNQGKFHCVIELQDAIAMAHQILAAAAQVATQEAEDSEYDAMFRRFADAPDASRMTVYSGWGHD